MALCLRMIIEYPIIGNFFKENKYKNNKTENLLLFKKKAKASNNNQSGTITLEEKIKWAAKHHLHNKAHKRYSVRVPNNKNNYQLDQSENINNETIIKRSQSSRRCLKTK